MSDVLTGGEAVRAYRQRERLSLDRLADLIAAKGMERPSAAKLSRIETGQPIPPELVPALEQITDVPAKDLRPDLAKMFLKGEAAE